MAPGADGSGRTANPDIESLLDALRPLAECRGPALAGLFAVYAQEARFGRHWLAPSLVSLAPGAEVLEVGAGAMILSSQFAREGYRVTALEPMAQGFSHFDELQEIVLAHAREGGFAPVLKRIPVEALEDRNRYDLAFSVNVMEHVLSVETALARVGAALRPGAAYRFTCANYRFPYEPHFDMPTLFSKRLTRRVFRRRIESCTRVIDPEGVWNSHNWITVAQVRAIAARMPEVEATFERGALREALDRVLTDPEFAARRSGAIRWATRLVVSTGLARLVRWMPAAIQPIMDCTIHRKGGAQ